MYPILIYTVRCNKRSDLDPLYGNNCTESETEELDDKCDVLERKIKGYYVRRLFRSRIKRILKEPIISLSNNL